MFVKTVLFRFRRLPVRRHQLLSYFYRYWLKIITGRPNARHEKSSKTTGAGKSPKTPLQDSRQTTENTENHKLKQACFIVLLNCTLNYGQIILANNSHTNPYNNSTARPTVVLRNYRS